MFGYRIEAAGAAQVLPWVNLNEIVVRFAGDMSNRGSPMPATVLFQSQRRAAPDSGWSGWTRCPATPTRSCSCSTARSAATRRPLRNGDRLTMTVAGAGPLDRRCPRFQRPGQGDVDGSGSETVADDFSSVKKKFFRSVTAPGDSADPAANYSPFDDVDGRARSWPATTPRSNSAFSTASPPPSPPRPRRTTTRMRPVHARPVRFDAGARTVKRVR